MNSAAPGESELSTSDQVKDEAVDHEVIAATAGLSRDELVQLVASLRRQLRGAETELGELRGDYAEMHVQLIRARQDQELYQRWIDRWRDLEHNAQRVEARLRRAVRGR